MDAESAECRDVEGGAMGEDASEHVAFENGRGTCFDFDNLAPKIVDAAFECWMQCYPDSDTASKAAECRNGHLLLACKRNLFGAEETRPEALAGLLSTQTYHERNDAVEVPH
jgi:hypothetical protein